MLVARWKSRAKVANDVAPIALANRIDMPNDRAMEDEYRTGLLYGKGPYLLSVLHKEVGAPLERSARGGAGRRDVGLRRGDLVVLQESPDERGIGPHDEASEVSEYVDPLGAMPHLEPDAIEGSLGCMLDLVGIEPAGRRLPDAELENGLEGLKPGSDELPGEFGVGLDALFGHDNPKSLRVECIPFTPCWIRRASYP